MKIINPLIIVLALIAIAYFGVSIGLTALFAVVIPYVAIAVFLIGFIYKVINWSKSPVPFRIPTTSGQQKSLSWIKPNKLDNPSGTLGVLIRMALEILLFRSLFKNTKAEVTKEGKVLFGSSKWLWLGGIVFHWSFLIILVRHSRFFLEPIPGLIQILEKGDSMMQIGIPLFYLTDGAILAAVSYLLLRRVVVPQMKYLSQPADYFPLYLILSIAITGILMRYFIRVDVVGIKGLARGLVTFRPNIPEGLSSLFYIHLFLISVLAIYFPFSKLMHLGGVFLSPTRNLANNNRAVRHINPWNPDIKIRTYEEYENDYREAMKKVGLPVDKE
jgi:nitrate reductase gamma subunit